MTIGTQENARPRQSVAAPGVDLNLRHLFVFMAVAESGSIAAAAQGLFRETPPLRGVILQSDMLAAMSAQQLHHEIVSGDLVILPIPLDEARRRIGIAQRHGALPPPGRT